MTRLFNAINFHSPIGQITVVESLGRIIAIRLGKNRAAEIEQGLWRHGYIPAGRPTPLLLTAMEQLKEYLSGRRQTFAIPFQVRGTGFEKRVWGAVQRIPYGETRSYAEVASAIDRPKAARAVGRAVAVNRLPILIPCHRVVASGGGLGGFSCGLDIKEFLLSLEQGHHPLVSDPRKSL